MEGIEGVEELVLDVFSPGQKLNVIDEQDIGTAVDPLKLGHVLAFERFDEITHELLRRHVDDPTTGFLGVGMVTDRL